MNFFSGLFRNAPTAPPVDTNGSVSAARVIQLISERAASFRGGQGMVLVTQLSWRVGIFVVDGVSSCSWKIAGFRLQLESDGEILSGDTGANPYASLRLSRGGVDLRPGTTEGMEAVSFELQRDSFAKLKSKLTSHFGPRVVSVQPLSNYADEQWCMQISFK